MKPFVFCCVICKKAEGQAKAMEIKTKEKEKKDRWWIVDVILESLEILFVIPRFVLRIVFEVYR